MTHVQLDFFDMPKNDLKIAPIYRNEQLLALLAERSGGGRSLPDAAGYYTTPVQFPKPGGDRPYTISSIVLSADGKMAYMDNREGPLIAKNNFADRAGGAADFWCLNMLRAYSDGLIIGANTLQNEPSSVNSCMEISLLRQRGEVLGKQDQPCQVIVSLDGTDIPFGHPTFRVDPEARLRVMLATSPAGWAYIKANSPLKHTLLGPFTDREQAECTAPAELNGGFDTISVLVTGEEDRPDTALMLYVLRRLGMQTVCVESPTYCAVLMDHGLLDEYFINYSMVYAGGMMTPGTAFPKGYREHPHAELVSVGIHRQNFLYTRQLLLYGVTAE